MEMNLENVIAAFQIWWKDLATPEGARDHCQVASHAFKGLLDAADVEATVVSGVYQIGDLIEWGHYAVRVGDDVYDWTARQFYPPAPWPMIVPWSAWCRLAMVQVDVLKESIG